MSATLASTDELTGPGQALGRPRRRRGRLAVAVGVAVAVAVAVGAVLWALPNGERGSAGTAPKTTSTVKVQRRDLANRQRVDGTLGYAPVPGSLVAHQAGMLTALAAEGAVVDRGQPLYAVDGTPVLLLFGSTPAYRDLVVGMTGPDVRQLKENLVASGRASWATIGDDDRFSEATADAVRRFQATAGVRVSGIIAQGDAVFLPGPLRVGTHKLEVGAAVAAGAEVTTVTTTLRVVTVKLDASQQGQVKVKDSVGIVLPTGTSTTGTVSDIASLAKLDTTGSKTTVDVTITLTDPAATGTIDQAPVRVAITTDSANDVLAVPVTALLALADGGYGVELVQSNGTDRLVAVRTGLFSDADNLVEISGGGLKEGDTVVVSQ